MESNGEILLGFILILFLICLYLLPTIIVLFRKKKSRLAIILINIFLGWTFLGWVCALVWAVIKEKTEDYNHEISDAKEDNKEQMKLTKRMRKINEQEERAKKEIQKYMDYISSLGENSKKHDIAWSGGVIEVYPSEHLGIEEDLTIDKDEFINRVIKNNYKVKEVVDNFVENELVRIEADKIKERQRKRKIREEAEKRVYGKVKTKRQSFTEAEKESILAKFDNKCAVCGKEEGLHIHHKDNNPKNNVSNNLIVLCGVCHKKIHMKVR